MKKYFILFTFFFLCAAVSCTKKKDSHKQVFITPVCDSLRAFIQRVGPSGEERFNIYSVHVGLDERGDTIMRFSNFFSEHAGESSTVFVEYDNNLICVSSFGLNSGFIFSDNALLKKHSPILDTLDALYDCSIARFPASITEYKFISNNQWVIRKMQCGKDEKYNKLYLYWHGLANKKKLTRKEKKEFLSSYSAFVSQDDASDYHYLLDLAEEINNRL